MTLYNRLELIIQEASAGLYEREWAFRLALLAAVAGSSVFFVGPPGVAKSLLARRIATIFKDAAFFDYLMGKFSTPDEIFGPVSLSRLKNDEDYSRNVQGYLPSADIVFLDEVWKANASVQNSLLVILNERIYRNGRQTIRVPLKCLLAASNEVHSGSETSAFWDRFLLRLSIEPIQATSTFKNYLENETAQNISITQAITQEEWESWRRKSRAIEFEARVLNVIQFVRQTTNESDSAEDYISDRRWKQIAELMKMSAFLHDRRQISLADACILQHCICSDPRQSKSDVLHKALEQCAFLSTVRSECAQKLKELRQSIQEATTQTRTIRKREPILLDGEYIAFALDKSEEDRDSHEESQTEYRIWSGDLPALTKLDGQEIECFVHTNAVYTDSIYLSVLSFNSESLELTTNIGAGRILSTEVDAVVEEAKVISPPTRERLRTEYTAFQEALEGELQALESEYSLLQSEMREHLFMPQSDPQSIQLAYIHERSKLRALLADTLVLGDSLFAF